MILRILKTHREEYSCICFCSYFQASGPPLCSFSPLPPTFEEPGERERRLCDTSDSVLFLLLVYKKLAYFTVFH